MISLPHKNHAVLFESIAKLAATGYFYYELILSGKQTKHWKSLERQIQRLGLEQTVRHLGFLPYEQVQRLYRGAECVLFPTTFEGFGLPVTEAFEAQKKIIVSRRPNFSRTWRSRGVSDRLRRSAAIGRGDSTTRRPRRGTVATWRETACATLQVLVHEASCANRNILPLRGPSRLGNAC